MIQDAENTLNNPVNSHLMSVEGESVANSRRAVRKVAIGLYGSWRKQRPSVIQRMFGAFGTDASERALGNDSLFEIEVSGTLLYVSTIRDRVILHRIQYDGTVVEVNETFQLDEYSEKHNFATDFYKIWRAATTYFTT